eukprot:4121786-Alexandrium_andersonii.AAC.1
MRLRAHSAHKCLLAASHCRWHESRAPMIPALRAPTCAAARATRTLQATRVLAKRSARAGGQSARANACAQWLWHV